MDKQRIKKPSFFTVIALIELFGIVVGFTRTFVIPLLIGSKSWPWTIFLHAAFAFSWAAIFLIQSLFIQERQYKLHIRLGKWSTLIALGAAISIIPAILFQIERELAEGFGEIAISSIVGSITSATMFLSLVGLGIVYRKKPQAHKRLMLLATIVLLWPAWFRWRHYFPSIDRPDIWFAVVLADSLIIVAFIWDWLKNKKIHPALLYGGLFIILENIVEIFLFDTSGWRAMANFLYNLLH